MLLLLTAAQITPCACPLVTALVHAGFPSPAEDFIEGELDLGAHLVRNRLATFFVRVAGDSMVGASLHPGDLLVVDRSLQAREGSIAIVVLDGELCVKRLRFTDGHPVLHAENPRYPPIHVYEGAQFEIWGIVTVVVHPVG